MISLLQDYLVCERLTIYSITDSKYLRRAIKCPPRPTSSSSVIDPLIVVSASSNGK